MVFSNNLLMGAAGQASGYDIDQSIRFNDNDSAHMARDGFGQSPTSSTDCTISVWVKRGSNLGSNSVIIYGGDPNGSTMESLRFGTGNQLQFSQASSDYDLKTTQVFRDPSAWYHIVAVLNTDAAESSRAALYVNGSQVTDFATENYPGSSYSTNFTANSSSVEHVIGSNAAASNASQFFDGYIAEFNFIDGQALTPSSFGETDSATGQWVPINYSGSYGNNGFHIDGRDSSDLGDDESGNGNDLAGSGLTTADQVTDSPTNNMPTLNPLSSGTGALSDGNLQYTGVSGNWSNSRLTLVVPETGKWAIRMKSASSYQQIIVGLCAPDTACPYTDIDVNNVIQIRYNTQDGNFVTRVGGSLVNDTGAPTTSAQTFFQLLFDMDNGKLGVAADGASSGTFADISTYSSLDLHGTALKTARQPFVQAYAGTDANAGVIIDVGQSGWETTVTGFKNLTLANAYDDPSIANPSQYFQSTTYTGNGSTQSINQSGHKTFQPDWVWIKNRDAADSHVLTDVVRGATKIISSDSTAVESTDADTLTAFESDGFALGDDDKVNTNTENYIAWQWRAGNTSGSTNDDGSVDSTVTVNTTAGFSIAKWVHTTSANYTVGHGLGATPKMVIVKTLDQGTNWGVYHSGITTGNRLILNTTAAQGTGYWGADTWNSTVFSIGSIRDANSSNAVGYVFAEVDGFSKFGTYTGNGDADGAFVYTGFKPAFLMFKVTSTTDSWQIYDTTRQDSNVFGRSLTPNENAVESSFSARVDLLSNGFKARSTNTAINGSSQDYIFMAFAETPFKTATAR